MLFFKTLPAAIASSIFLATQAEACLKSDTLIERRLPWDQWVFSGHLIDNGVTYCWSNGKFRDNGDKKFHFDCKDGRWATMDDNSHVEFGYGSSKFSFNQECYSLAFAYGTGCKGTNYC